MTSGRDNVNRLRIHRFQSWLLVLLVFFALSGCRLLTRRYAGPAQDGSLVSMPNPMVVPVSSVEFTWTQIVDMVDDYFDIADEQQVREIGGVLMEGRITSQPKAGATWVEPLLRDSANAYERWHSTLQSIRRTAHLRVVPVANGFEVFVEVDKEVEDVSQPEYSTVATSAERHDGSLIAVDRFDRNQPAYTLGWISIGRDESLEQEMLRNLHARLFQTAELPAN